MATGLHGIGWASYQVKAVHPRWTICFNSCSMALVQFLPLEPTPLDEINNILEAPEMLCSLAEKWCFMKCHLVQPSAENPIWQSLETTPFILSSDSINWKLSISSCFKDSVLQSPFLSLRKVFLLYSDSWIKESLEMNYLMGICVKVDNASQSNKSVINSFPAFCELFRNRNYPTSR